MLVKNILGEKGREVVSISSDATLSEATRLLARRRIGAVVVRDETGALAGILSERDVVHAVADESVTSLARERAPRVRMPDEVVSCVAGLNATAAAERRENI